jgi:hypothetical protein
MIQATSTKLFSVAVLVVSFGVSVTSPSVAQAVATGASVPASISATAGRLDSSVTKVVTRKVKTYGCDASPPVRTTTVTVIGRTVTAKAGGETFVATRKAGHKEVDLWRKPSQGFPYPQLSVTFASKTSKKAVKAQHLC